MLRATTCDSALVRLDGCASGDAPLTATALPGTEPTSATEAPITSPAGSTVAAGMTSFAAVNRSLRARTSAIEGVSVRSTPGGSKAAAMTTLLNGVNL